MIRASLTAASLLILSAQPGFAQSWDWGENGSPWGGQRGYRDYRYEQPFRGPTPPGNIYRRPGPSSYGNRRSRVDDDDDDDDDDDNRFRRRSDDRPRGPALLEGGPRPAISPMRPEAVRFSSNYAPGTIVIETRGRQLFLVGSSGQALRYPISVGREGFTWKGTEKVSRIADWPDWHPPAEMRERDPKLPEKMTGGLRNPLGAKAIYLGSTLYRIHGTNDAKSIGRAASSGCFRMLNGQVIDLASRVQVGASVVVVEKLPREVAAQ